jgi:hypothetical protein
MHIEHFVQVASVFSVYLIVWNLTSKYFLYKIK